MNAVGSRLQRVEQAVQQLSASLRAPLRNDGSVPPNSKAVVREISPGQVHSGVARDVPSGTDRTPYISHPTSLSFLAEASATLDKPLKSSDCSARQGARSELRHLSETVTASVFDEEGGEHSTTGFHIPTRTRGYALISQFAASAPIGRLFFDLPTDDGLFQQVVFDPSRVKEKAWVVYFNYMMLAAVSTEPSNSTEAAKFRSNTRLALNDSRIFLVPSIVNVQTFAMLAIHGEDFASPNQSWMLVGHACRQAEALDLHLPADYGSNSAQQRLSLFWLLFVIDKVCSMAFGRPPLLPTTTYQHVPNPDYDYLAKNCPHISEAFDPEGQTWASRFGAQFYIGGFEVAKLTGLVLEALSMGHYHLKRDDLRSQLDRWYSSTNRELCEAMHAEKAFASPAQLREMSLGIRCMEFQYLHVLIVLLRDDTSRLPLRVESSRKMLSILPSMVSNWDSVYNGVIWQLLYYPFVPFFVIFGFIVSEPTVNTTDQDLALLSTTVSYFESMRTKLSLLATLSCRLRRVATVFLRLARQHVAASVQATTDSVSDSPNLHQKQTYTEKTWLETDHLCTNIPFETCSSPSQPSQRDLDLDFVDLSTYLKWLPADITNVLPAFEGQHDEMQTEFIVPRGHSRPLDSMFDWFSWDAEYAGNNFEF